MKKVHDESYIDYLQTITPNNESWVSELEKEAAAEHIPIMSWPGIQLLQQIIRLHQPKRILEIGTAIGYSALRMNQASKKAQIVSAERDKEMYNQALKNIKSQNKTDRIDLLFGDALEIREEIIEKGPYDLIFIDAAKGQYLRFFETFAAALTDTGCIITDNVLFRGYVTDPLLAPKRLRKLAEKINYFNKWLMNNPDFYTSIFPIGDGVAVSIKKQ